MLQIGAWAMHLSLMNGDTFIGSKNHQTFNKATKLLLTLAHGYKHKSASVSYQVHRPLRRAVALPASADLFRRLYVLLGLILGRHQRATGTRPWQCVQQALRSAFGCDFLL